MDLLSNDLALSEITPGSLGMRFRDRRISEEAIVGCDLFTNCFNIGFNWYLEPHLLPPQWFVQRYGILEVPGPMRSTRPFQGIS